MVTQAAEASQEVPSREALSVGEFEDLFLGPRRPVVLKGVAAHWPCMGAWTPDSFRTRFGDDRVRVRRFSDFKHEEMSLAAYIDFVTSGAFENDPDRKYMIDWTAFQSRPSLRNELGRIQYFENWLNVVPPKVQIKLQTGWEAVLIGAKGAVCKLHYDYGKTHACAVQVYGRKRWVLYPPDQGERLTNLAGTDFVDVNRPDHEEFPLFSAAAGRMEAVVHPGDMIFVPLDWWHQVENLDVTIAVTMNFLNRSNFREWVKYQFTKFRPKKGPETWLDLP